MIVPVEPRGNLVLPAASFLSRSASRRQSSREKRFQMYAATSQS